MKGAHISRLSHLRNKLLSILRTASFLAQYFFKKLLFVFNKRLPALKTRYAHSFPAVHLRKMDSLDYVFNFSSEILILALAIIVVLMNTINFGIPGFHKEQIADQSLAAKFLSLHAQLNNKLYVHNSAVKTTVVAGSNFATTAYAAEEVLSAGPSGTDGEENEENFESVITKPPVDAKDLLQNQIQIYQSVSGDTLYSIAKKFAVYTDVLAWSNGLRPGDAIKPGWYFIIPKDSKTVVVKTKASDSIPGLAKKFKVSEDTIINANALEDAGDIDQGIYLYIPGGTITDTPKPVAKNSKSGSDPIGSTLRILGGNLFPKYQCTWYVATQVRVYWRGNAKDWPRNAAAAGATVNKTPGVGKIAVTPDSRYGHVSMVRAIYDNGTVLLEDYNYSSSRKHGTHIERISRVQAFITP